MLKITVEEKPELVKLKLEGKVSGAWVDELERAWYAVHEKGAPIVLDLSGVTFIDEEGKKLFGWMFAQGTELHAIDCLNKAVVSDIERKHPRPDGPPRSAPGGRNLAITIVLLLTSWFIASTRLQGQDQTPLKLTLRDAVQMALKQNPEVLIANLNVATAEQDRNVARSALLPQVGLEGFDRAQRFNLQALMGRSFPGFAEHVGPFEVFQAGPIFSLPIFDLTLFRKLQASQEGIRASQSQELSVREQTVLLVVSQYLAGLRAAADVKAAQSRVELAQALYDQAADLQKNGVGTGLDTLRGNVQLQNEKQRLVVAQTELKTSLYGLARLLNLSPRQDVELADEVSFFQTPAFPLDQSVENALASRPEMKALTAQERGAVLVKRAAGESRLPTFNVTGTWGYQGLSLPSSIPAYVYTATLDVPLFTGGRIRAERVKADLQLKRIAQQKQELSDQIALEVKTAIAQLEAARDEVGVANLGVNLAKEEVTQARDRFQAGVANNIEVITAQDELARANDNQISALYAYNQSRANLARALGQIEGLYAK